MSQALIPLLLLSASAGGKDASTPSEAPATGAASATEEVRLAPVLAAVGPVAPMTTVGPVAPAAIPAPPADRAHWGGFYAGLSGGVTDARTEGDDLDDDLDFAFTTNSDLDSTFFGWKLYGGYRFPGTPWSLELAYVDLGELESDIVAAPPDLGAFQDAVEDEHPLTGRGVALSGRYSFEFADRFAVSAKAGGWWWDSTAEFTTIQPPGGTRTTESVDESGIDLVAGLGLEVGVWEGLHARAEVEKYWLDGDDTDLFSVGVFWVFR